MKSEKAPCFQSLYISNFACQIELCQMKGNWRWKSGWDIQTYSALLFNTFFRQKLASVLFVQVYL